MVDVKGITKRELGTIKNDIKIPVFFYLSLVFTAIGFFTTLLFYLEKIPNNFISGYMWPCSLVCIVLSFINISSFKIDFKEIFHKDNRGFWLFFLLVTVIYFASHFYNFENAPWNNYGLFDDAAWDIYLAKKHCFNGETFEIIFWDEEIGRISRELFFHYYIMIFFKLFGYNLLVFNVSLVILGYVTVLFTGLIAYEIFNNYFYAFIASIVINFYPLHFTQVFMGHRYAICAPLIAVSVWFLWRAFKRGEVISALCGGIFAGFAMESAIMGKQYIWALWATLIVFCIFNFRRLKHLTNRICLILMTMLGYVVAAAPLYAYIWTHKAVYNIREANMIDEFFARLKVEGFALIMENIKALCEMLFAPFSGMRQFSGAYPVFTWYLLALVVIGMVIAFVRKHYVLLFMVAIPLAGNCVTIPYDFRVLIIAPAVAVLTTYALSVCGNLILKFKLDRKYVDNIVVCILTLLICISPIKYLVALANDPNSEYLLHHRLIAACRFVQDVTVGDGTYDIAMHNDEFNRPMVDSAYDTFAATEYSYAHVHAYLEKYGDREILSFGGNFPFQSTSDWEIRENMASALEHYAVSDKGLRIVIEYSDKVADVVNDIDRAGYGNSMMYSFEIDGTTVAFYVITVENPDVRAFIENATYNIRLYQDMPGM